MLSNTVYWLIVEQIADLNIYANLKWEGFFPKAGIVLKELSKCTVRISVGVACWHNFVFDVR